MKIKQTLKNDSGEEEGECNVVVVEDEEELRL